MTVSSRSFRRPRGKRRVIGVMESSFSSWCIVSVASVMLLVLLTRGPRPCSFLAALIKMSVADKTWWGPRVWRILHGLAEVSDRPALGMAWKAVLRATVLMIPCDLCRHHFQSVVASIAFPLEEIFQSRLRHVLWSAHAAAGSTRGPGNSDCSGAVLFPEEALTSEYGMGGDREAVLTQSAALCHEVVASFRAANVLDRFRLGALVTWDHAVRALISAIRLPPPPAKKARSGNSSSRPPPLRYTGARFRR
jgi:hypothetical protein